MVVPLALLAALVLVVLVIRLAAARPPLPAAPAGPAIARPEARWRANHRAENGVTAVVVALTNPDGEVVEEHVVARFADADPAWERKFLAAREEAERRAFHLNADRP